MTKKLKQFTVNTIASICRLSGISDKSIGIIIRSYHFTMPLLLMLAILIPDSIISNLAVLFYIGVVFLFFLFNGCFVSALENKFCKDDFNIVDPLLEFTKQPINNSSRMVVSYFILICYTIVFFSVYYFRFLYNKPFTLY